MSKPNEKPNGGAQTPQNEEPAKTEQPKVETKPEGTVGTQTAEKQKMSTGKKVGIGAAVLVGLGAIGLGLKKLFGGNDEDEDEED